MNTTSEPRYRDNPKMALATALLGRDVKEWVRERREEYGQSWDRISLDMLKATKGQCRISREHLRRNFGEPIT